MKRNYKMFVEDIVHAMDKIEQYLNGMTFEQFMQNEMLIDAVIRNLEIIGEAARNVPKNIREKYHRVSWRKMSGLRNILIHEYFGIDEENVWEIATKNLPETKEELELILKELD